MHEVMVGRGNTLGHRGGDALGGESVLIAPQPSPWLRSNRNGKLRYSWAVDMEQLKKTQSDALLL